MEERNGFDFHKTKVNPTIYDKEFLINYSSLNDVIQNCLISFYDNSFDKNSKISKFLTHITEKIPQSRNLRTNMEILDYFKKEVFHKHQIPDKDRNKIVSVVNEFPKYGFIDPFSSFKKIQKNIIIDKKSILSIERNYSNIVKKHNIQIHEMTEIQPSLVGMFRGLFVHNPVSCSILLGALRKYCDVFSPPEYILLKPTFSYCILNFESRLESKYSQFGIDSLSFEEMVSMLVFMYEKSMLYKFGGDPNKAHTSLLEIEQIVLDYRSEIRDALQILRRQKVNLDHQLFTFRKIESYIEFQLNLLRSTLGKEEEIKWFGKKCTKKLIKENLRRFAHRNSWENGSISEELYEISRDRVLIHVDTLMRRKYSKEEYSLLLEDDENGKKFKSILLDIKTNKRMREHVRYRWIHNSENNGAENVSDESSYLVRKMYNKCLKDFFVSLCKDEDNLGEKRQFLDRIGDISINNPLYRHSGKGSFSFLSFFHEFSQKSKHKTSRNSNLKDMRDLFPANDLSDRILVTNYSMVSSKIGNINRANIYADAALVNSLRNEKTKSSKNKKSSSELTNEGKFVVHSSGHLGGISFKFENYFPRDLKIELKSQNNSKIDSYSITNHFIHSYHAITPFKKSNNNIPNTTLKLSRINVLGKGLRELSDIFLRDLNDTSHEIVFRRVNQTIAENHPFAIIPDDYHDLYEEKPYEFVFYLSMFVITRISELINLLHKVELLLRTHDIPAPYYHRMEKLVSKYATILECELDMVETLLQEGTFSSNKDIAKKILNSYKNKILTYVDTSKRTPTMYLKYLIEIDKVEDLISDENYLSELTFLRKSCISLGSLEHNTHGGTRVSQLEEKRKFILGSLINSLDDAEKQNDISSYNIFYTRLLTSKLITEYAEIE